MAGLNYGKSYKQFSDETFPNQEGVFYSKFSKKWVVRVGNNGIDKIIRPFVSIAQYQTEALASEKYDEAKSNK